MAGLVIPGFVCKRCGHGADNFWCRCEVRRNSFK